MTHNEMIAVIQAHENGKTIQYRNERGIWEDVEPSWNFEKCDYRVKRESDITPYDFEEFVDALAVHGNVVRAKGVNIVNTIESANEQGVLLRHGFVPYPILSDVFEWLDGTPCGTSGE